LLQQKRPLQELAARMLERPEEVLPRFVDLAMEMTGAVSAGLSLYEGDDTREFRWRYLRGLLSTFEGATTPRDFSPCGVTLDRNAPVLALHPERCYDWISEANIVVPEVLLVPLYIGGKEPLGTLWIVSAVEGHFHGGHARSMTDLASFVGAALCILQGQQRLQQALEEQGRLVAEMDHRIKNLFAIADSMIRSSARATSSKEDLAAALSGRLRALASAHSLVWRRGHKDAHGHRITALSELIETLLCPHNASAEPRYSLQGPAANCSERMIDGLALVFHELGTNAVKYGALASEGGRVDIRWREEDGQLVLTWIERGGPPVDGPVTTQGYGSRLVHATITGQFGGTLTYDWHRDGLAVTIAMPRAMLLQ
jgi:two-component sensor histidine kinase